MARSVAASRRVLGVDLSIVVLVVVVVFLAIGMVQAMHQWDDAQRGLLSYEQARKDAYIDAGLIQRSSRVRVHRSLVATLRSETVMVATRVGGHAFVGAGVIVGVRNGQLQIVTARHVIEHDGEHIVYFTPHLGTRVKKVVLSHKDDLALLSVKAIDGVTYSVGRFAKSELQTGTPFVVMGHPGLHAWLASTGLAEKHQRQTLLFCPTCDRGDSGAGVFDRNGGLLGIVVLKVRVNAPSKRTGRYFTFTAFEAETLANVRNFVKSARRA
ncbi:MAG: trypsin-like peptidase domain-containing protein [Candidatus Eremiobacteraeota bacterium]|nr:trypsin-like peptidase domain-containing protein [Candidatus Eremiobacteraeota bacterium]